MDNGLDALQSRTEQYYRDILTPLAQRYHLEINMPRQLNAGKPTILFLGNHSSGKSTFINYLLDEPVQKTGIAPTDDGFTILSFSEQAGESSGPAAAMRPEVTFTGLDRFGPAFLSRLKLKLLNLDLLRKMTLVDSPGMIDAATTAQERGYDFMSAVRTFGESADLVLFFLDPEKPGTTGETISAFTQGLSGLENKTLILMNKADIFSSIRDFARDYGALCWNLSRVIQTKDMPEVYTTYIPGADQLSSNGNDTLSLTGFDEAREEVVHHINSAMNRRVDNVISTLKEQAERLDMHVRVCWDVKRSVLMARSVCAMITFTIFGVTAALGALFRNSENFQLPLIIVCAGLLLTVLWWAISRFVVQRIGKNKVDGIEGAYRRIYERDFTLGQRDDLRARWAAVRGPLEKSLAVMGVESVPARPPTGNRRYRRLQKLIDKDIAALRKRAK